MFLLANERGFQCIKECFIWMPYTKVMKGQCFGPAYSEIVALVVSTYWLRACTPAGYLMKWCFWVPGNFGWSYLRLSYCQFGDEGLFFCAAIFERRRHFNVPVQWARHPDLREYIHSAVTNLQAWIQQVRKSVSRALIIHILEIGLTSKGPHVFCQRFWVGHMGTLFCSILFIFDHHMQCCLLI